MMTLKSVSLSVNILLFMLLIICLRSCCITNGASHTSAKLNDSAPKTDLTVFLDFMIKYSMIEAFWFLSAMNMMKTICYDPLLLPLNDKS